MRFSNWRSYSERINDGYLLAFVSVLVALSLIWAIVGRVWFDLSIFERLRIVESIWTVVLTLILAYLYKGLRDVNRKQEELYRIDKIPVLQLKERYLRSKDLDESIILNIKNIEGGTATNLKLVCDFTMIGEDIKINSGKSPLVNYTEGHPEDGVSNVVKEGESQTFHAEPIVILDRQPMRLVDAAKTLSENDVENAKLELWVEYDSPVQKSNSDFDWEWHFQPSADIKLQDITGFPDFAPQNEDTDSGVSYL